MKTTISVCELSRLIAACAALAAGTWTIAAATNVAPQDVSAALQRQLQEQTKRIDRLYRAIGPQLSELEERAAAFEAQEREGKALALQTIRQVSDENLSGIGANSPGPAEFGVLTTEGGVRLYDGNGDLEKELHPSGTAITCLAFSHSGKSLPTGTEDWTLMVWDLANKSYSVLSTNLGEKVERVTWLGHDRVAWATQRIYWGNDGRRLDHDKPAGRGAGARCRPPVVAFPRFCPQ
jgi:hypothetical protein